MQETFKYFGIIPARSGSKGIVDKNIQFIGNKPMIQFTLESANNSKLIDKLIVSTDDERIIKLSKELGIAAPFVRPKKLAQDDSSLYDVVVHSLDWLKYEYGDYPENIVLLQPTSPFRNSNDIDSSIRKFELTNSKSLISVCEVSQHPSDCVYINMQDSTLREVFSKQKNKEGRQGFEQVYFIDGSIYISSTFRFLNEKKFWDRNSDLYLLQQSHSIDVDTPFDLELARSFLFYKERNEFKE